MLFRGNVLASAIGTFFGNPWTFILIWLADYEVGLGIIHAFGYGADLHVLSIDELGAIMRQCYAFSVLFWEYILGGYIARYRTSIHAIADWWYGSWRDCMGHLVFTDLVGGKGLAAASGKTIIKGRPTRS